MNESSAAGSAKVIGIAMIILGVMALAAPMVIGESVLLVIGISIVLAGVLRMIWAFKADSLGSGIWKFLLGVLTLAAGVFVVGHPLMASGVLTIVIATYLFADGLVEVILSFTMKDVKGKGWLMIGGVLSVVLGCLLFFQAPLSGVLALGVFLGVKMIFAGMTALSLGTTLHTMAREQAG